MQRMLSTPQSLRSRFLALFALLLLALPGVSAGLPLAAAGPAGLLATYQPVEGNVPAHLKFYAPDAALVHDVALPLGVDLAANALAPDGRHFAYLTGSVSGPQDVAAGQPLQNDLTLHVLRTSDGTDVIAIPLLPDNFPENVAINAQLVGQRDPSLYEFGDLEESVWLAFMVSLGNLRWSPDGETLAFSAAIHGPSSDLYTYNTRTRRIARLTDGIEQIDGLRWSPDGQWIWHSTVSYAYCQTCGGHQYGAAADGSTVVTLPGTDVERFLAWTDGDSYLLTDQANGPGDFALQRVDITTGESQMLWPGTHQGFIYDPAMNRLGIVGTRGKSYDPNEQVFVVDLTTGEDTEYDDLDSALAVAPWLAPLSHRPITYPCHRAGPIVRPCNDLPYDRVSPDGTLFVTEDYAVEEIEGAARRLPPESELGRGQVLWRPDGLGFFITQPNLVVYRDLASGDYTVLDDSVLLGWLPLASSTDFAAPPPAPVETAEPTIAPTSGPTPISTPIIENPYRYSTLVGKSADVASTRRAAQAQELAALSQQFNAADAPSVEAQTNGLPLLLAREAAITALYPPAAISVAPEAAAAPLASLDAALAAAPSFVATYPASGALPNLNSLALSPDGSVVASGHTNGTVRLWDYASGDLLRVLSGSTTSIRDLSFSSDGEMVAATDYNGRVQIWNVASGMQSRVYQGRYLSTNAAAWRPNSEEIAIANGSDPVMVQPRNTVASPLINAAAEKLAYSPDGTQLAVALQAIYPAPAATMPRGNLDAIERPIWIVDADTGEVLHELADDRITYYLAYTPDGSKLVVGSGYLLRVWDVASATLLFETELPDFPNGWAMTPDGEELAIMTRRAGISFYDLNSGENVHNIAVDASVMAWLAIHPTDAQLISGEINGRPFLLDPEDGTPLYRFGAPRARLVATSPRAPLVATADIRTITLYDLNTQHPLREFTGADHFITDIAFSLDGTRLAAREESGHLLLWDVGRGELVWRVAISDEWAGKVAFAPTGDLISGGSDGILRLIDHRDGAVLGEHNLNTEIVALAVSSRNEATLVIGRPNGIAVRVILDGMAEGNVTLQTVAAAATVRSQPAYSPDGALLAVIRSTGSGAESVLDFINTEDNTSVRTIALGELYSINAAAFSPDGKSFATGAYSSYPDIFQPITLWDVATGEPLHRFGDGKSTQPSLRLAFAVGGDYLFASDEKVITTQYPLTPTHTLRTIASHRGGVWDVTLSPDGQWAVTAGNDHHVRVWNWQTGAQLYQVIEEPERVYSVDVSPNGDAILTGGEDGLVRLYYASGDLQNTFPAHQAAIHEVAFRPDGDAFASAGQDGTLRVFHRSRGTESWHVEWPNQDVSALAYSPNSDFLAAAVGGPSTTLYIFDAYSGEEITQFAAHDNYVVSLAYSPDNSLLASASWDRTIKLWDAASGELLATLEGHRDLLTGMTFSPDGTLLASVAEDYTLRLWNVADHTEVTRIDLPRALPWAVAFSPDGHALLTSHADGKLRTWLINPADDSTAARLLLAAARVPRATAEFTAQERRAYAIDSFVGVFPLSASGNINLRAEPTVKSLTIRPQGSGVVSETLIALTDERFLLTSTDQGESWRIVTRLPLTLTVHSLSVLARPDDPLMVATAQGLFRVADDGALLLVHPDALLGVSYSHTNANELWGVRSEGIVKSEDGGATWGTASADLSAYRLFAPLLMAPPNNNPQMLAGLAQDTPAQVLWRGAANGFWQRLVEMPVLPLTLTDEQGIAWDAGNRTLYMGGAGGELFASDLLDAPDIANVTASIVEQFGPGTRPVPLAVGQGPSLYVNLLTPYGGRFLRGTWDGNTWQWVEMRLPIVAAG